MCAKNKCQKEASYVIEEKNSYHGWGDNDVRTVVWKYVCKKHISDGERMVTQ